MTKTVAEFEIGVVTTDIHGNGKYSVVIGPVPSGTYELEFFARNGAGCLLVNGGPCDANHAEADFQSPGPIWKRNQDYGALSGEKHAAACGKCA